MKRLFALIAVLCAFGCEDTYVREHIIDNFVCVYMPWWMGDCQGAEVTNKVMGVLDHGLISAQATCTVAWSLPWQGPYPAEPTRLSMLVDGSVLWEEKGPAFRIPGRLCELHDECAAAAALSVSVHQNYDNTVTIQLHDGLFTVVGAGGDFLTYEGHSPATIVSENITDVCTGFNLEAFGVE